MSYIKGCFAVLGSVDIIFIREAVVQKIEQVFVVIDNQNGKFVFGNRRILVIAVVGTMHAQMRCKLVFADGYDHFIFADAAFGIKGFGLYVQINGKNGAFAHFTFYGYATFMYVG